MNRRFAAILLLAPLLLAACSPRELRQAMQTARQARAEIVSAYAGPALRPLLAGLLQQEVAAKRSQDAAALEAILDPQADPAWLERQRAVAEPALSDVAITRLWTNGLRATAAVIETSRETSVGTSVGTSEDQLATQFYTIRTFRQVAPGEWLLTSPAPADWGRRRAIEVDGAQIVYREFDDPYVRAVAPRLAVVLPQVVADFGLPLTVTQGLRFNIAPGFVLAAAGMTATTTATATVSSASVLNVPSPLSPGFPLAQAQSPDEFLLGFLTDVAGHGLLHQSFGATAADPARMALAHTAVQWEAEQATGRDYTADLLAHTTDAATPLSTLLDPTLADATGTLPNERDLFIRFVADHYGRSTVARFVSAVFSSDDAEALSRAAFNRSLADVERDWQAWLAQRR